MKSYRIIINSLFLLSFVIVIWLNFFKNLYIPTSLSIDVDNVNRLIETIAIAYMTSYIFYLVIYVFKSQQDKKIILPFVADYIYVAMNNCRTFCSSMRNEAGLEYILSENSIHDRNMDIYPNKKDIAIICSVINPNQEKENKLDLPGFVSIPTFFGVMINYVHRIDYFLRIILDKSMFLDTELIRILTDIQTHGFHQNMMSYDKGIILTAKHRHNNLKVYEDSLRSYTDLFVKLETYAGNNLKKYVQRDSLKIKTKRS
jgi:hypothetical protein